MVSFRQNYRANNPSQPDRYLEHHQDEDEGSFSIIVFYAFGLDGEKADKDDEEDDVEEREDVVGGVEAAGRHQRDPLRRDDALHQHAEPEQQQLHRN